MGNSEEIKNWAPVLIPTLCRYSHFKQLIESLDNCVGACNTDVYVALDYPAKESHIEGWMKIKEYLKNKSFRFKKFVVHEREYNHGTGKNGNYMKLREDVVHKYKAYITTEDDNVFSPNFLVYMNKGLQKYEKDDSVIAICGYRFFYDHIFNDNNFFYNQQDYNAWGLGRWTDKQKVFDNIDHTYFRSKLWDFRALKKVWNAGPVLFSRFLDYTNEKSFKKADYFYGLYMILENKYQIMPRISKVRNMGWDDSGLHCNSYPREIVYKHINQQIDESDSFEFIGSGFEYFEENKRIMRDEDYNKKYASRFKNLCKLILLQLGLLK